MNGTNMVEMLSKYEKIYILLSSRAPELFDTDGRNTNQRLVWPILQGPPHYVNY